MSNRLKTYPKSITEIENTTLKNKILFGGWFSTAFKVYRRNKVSGKALPNRFEDWIQREHGIKKKNNYKNLYKLVRVAPKLFNCRVNATYFIKNHDILIDYFQNIHRGIMFLTAGVKIATQVSRLRRTQIVL